MAIEYPYSDKAEKAVLGAMMVDEDAQRVGLSSLIEEDFYVPSNRLVFDCMKRLNGKNLPIDITTLTDDLVSMDKLEVVGGVAGLTALARGVVVPNLDSYIIILKEKKNLRDILDLINQITDDISNKTITNSDEYLDEVEKKVMAIARNRQAENFITTKDLIAMINERYKAGRNKLIGVTSGYSDLDRYSEGFQNGDVIILAARTSVGKSQFAVNLALNAASITGRPVGFFSIEMPAIQIMTRMLATTSMLDSGKLKTFNMSDEDFIKFEEGARKIANLDIYFDDTSKRMLDIQTNARKLKSQHPDLAVIFIDYLQMIVPTKQSKADGRTQIVGELSREVKNLARELDVPIVCLAQLSRSAAEKGEKKSKDDRNKKPSLIDLRESGSIEQDADMVMLLHRESYYDTTNTETLVQADLIIAKNRNGRTGEVHFTFDLATGAFNLGIN